MPRPFDKTCLIEVIGKYPTLRDNILPILHETMELFGFIDRQAIPLIADYLNISIADVHGVISFYDDFRLESPGKKIVKICRAEACQAVGSESLEIFAKERLGIGYHETTSDGNFTLEPVYCLGNCACSPSVMVENKVYGRVNENRLRKLLSQ